MTALESASETFRIVVVDDHPDIADMTCTLLRLLGHDAHAAVTGELGLSVIAEHTPQIAILDIGLPDISGYDLARQLRSKCGSAVYLCAITGWGDFKDRERAFAAGFDRHMLKPVSVGALREMLVDATLRLEQTTIS